LSAQCIKATIVKTTEKRKKDLTPAHNFSSVRN